MVTGKPVGLLILFLSSVDEENTHNNDIKNISKLTIGQGM